MINSKYFSLGQVVMTHKVNDTIAENRDFLKDVIASLHRHCNKDWGCMPEEDKALNDEAVKTGMDRIFSAYMTCKGKIYIITEADRSATTILFPEDY